MMKKILTFILSAAALFIFCVSASADTGPKPSAVFRFEADGVTELYATMLSDRDRHGPYSVYAAGDNSMKNISEADGDIFMKFVRYEAPDGWYFIQHLGYCDLKAGENTFSWNYYPPENFRLLLYFPEKDVFSVSQPMSLYAFDSTFRVSINSDLSFETEKTPEYGEIIKGCALRFIICLAAELLIALPFGFYEKKQLAVITLTNAVTQLILNSVLGASLWFRGSYIPAFILLEIFIFTAEAVIYARMLTHAPVKPDKKYHPVIYALAANTVSFIAGLVIR